MIEKRFGRGQFKLNVATKSKEGCKRELAKDKIKSGLNQERP
mgnify:CR=1 FL=1